MNDNETQRLLGELHGKLDQFMSESKEDLKELRAELVDLKKSHTVLQNEISLYKTIVKIIRALLLTIVSVLAFKFGDISSYWHGFFDGK